MFTTILAPVQLSRPDLAQRTAETAHAIAQGWGATLVLGTIMPHWVTVKDADYSWEARRWFEARATLGLERLKARCGIAECRTRIEWGAMPGSILDMAEGIDADLIVLAAQDRDWVDALRPPSSVRVAARAGCSVLLAR